MKTYLIALLLGLTSFVPSITKPKIKKAPANLDFENGMLAGYADDKFYFVGDASNKGKKMQLTVLDKNLAKVASSEYDVPSYAKIGYLYADLVGDHIVVYFPKYNVKYKYIGFGITYDFLMVQKFDKTTLKPVGELTEVFNSNDAGFEGDEFTVLYNKEADRYGLMVFSSSKQKKVFINLEDSQQKTIYKKTYDLKLSYERGYFKTGRNVLNNKGEVFFFAHGASSEKSETTYMVKISPSGDMKYEKVTVKGGVEFISTPVLTQAANGDILAAYAFSKDNIRMRNGFTIQRYDAETLKLKTSADYPFTQKLLDYSNSRNSETVNKKNQINGINPEYLFVEEDGSVIIVCEQYYTKPVRDYRYPYHNFICVFKFDENFKEKFLTIIPKEIDHMSFEFAAKYSAHYYDKKIHVFYNQNFPINTNHWMKYSVVDANGEMETIDDFAKSDANYIYNPIPTPISDNQILFEQYRTKSATAYGKIKEVKLSLVTLE